jgi:hypothetical protein
MVRVDDAPAVPFTTRLLRRPAEPVHGTIFVPVSAAPRAAVLLIGGSGGSEPSYVAEPLASAGIAALSVAYFARPGLPGELRDISLEYFFSALEVLRDQLPPGTPLAVLGMSRGSEAAMLTAIWSGARVHGVLATVPGNVVAGSWPPGGSAWLLDGRPLPYANHADLTDEDLRTLIPVEQVPARSSCWPPGRTGYGRRPPWRGRCPGGSANTAIPMGTCCWSTPVPGTASDT